MGLGKFLKKALKVVAVVAAVVTAVYTINPEFATMVMGSISSISESLAPAVTEAMTAAGDVAGAEAVASAASEATDGLSALSSLAESVPEVAAEVGTNISDAASQWGDIFSAPVSGAADTASAGFEALNEGVGAAQAASSTVPEAANFSSGMLSNVVKAPEQMSELGGFVAPSAATQIAQDAALNVAPSAATQIAPDAATQVAFNAGKDSQLAWEQLGGAYKPNTNGILSNAFNATTQFVKENPLLASMGFTLGSSLLKDEPKNQAVELQDWMRNNNSQAVVGSYRPASQVPQQPLRRTDGSQVFNRPGMLTRG